MLTVSQARLTPEWQSLPPDWEQLYGTPRLLQLVAKMRKLYRCSVCRGSFRADATVSVGGTRFCRPCLQNHRAKLQRKSLTKAEMVFAEMDARMRYLWRPDQSISLDDPHRICHQCWTPKSPSEFYGANYTCKECHDAKWNPIFRARYVPRPRTFKCMKCGGKFPPSNFPTRGNGKRNRNCASCAGAISENIQRRFAKAFAPSLNSHHRRHAVVAALSDGTITGREMAKLKRAARYCLYCGAAMGDADKTVDHMEPLSLGGAHSVANIVICCRSCNSRKRNKPFAEWLTILDQERRDKAEKLYVKRYGSTPDQHIIPLVYRA